VSTLETPTIPPVITSIPDRDINDVKLNVDIQDKRIGTIENVEEVKPKRVKLARIIGFSILGVFILAWFILYLRPYHPSIIEVRYANNTKYYYDDNKQQQVEQLPLYVRLLYRFKVKTNFDLLYI
jgi:hypothetical protein